MKFVDANVIVRYLARDDEAMFQAARTLFERIDSGEERVTLLDVTVAEVVYVLASPRLYALTASEIADRLQGMVGHRGIQMPAKQRTLRALEIYAAHAGVNYGDAVLCAAALDDGEEIYSFDRGLDRVAGISRVEP